MRRRALLVAFLVWLACPAPGQAQIDASRRIDWSRAGVTGGIPSRSTICSTLNPGATADQINSAIAACSNGVVYLNAGTYTLSSGITFSGRSNVTLRGAGPDQTIVKFTVPDPCGGLKANLCVHGPSSIWSGNLPSSNIRNWTGGYAKGTTQITLDSAAGLTSGMFLILDQLNDTVDTGGVLVTDSTSGFSLEGGTPGRTSRAQQQYVQVTGVSGNTVTITPGLYMPNWRASQQPQVWWWGDSSVMDGVEDMTLDHTLSSETSGVAFHNAYNCWVKNVKSINPNRNHVWMYQAPKIEVRNSYFYGTKNAASQSYGVESFMASDPLVVNNIFQHITGPIVNGPVTGGVYAYNFATDIYYNIATWMMSAYTASHDAGTGLNLFEGNAGNSFLMDTFHGTGNLTTLFRNQLTGTEPGKSQGNTIPVQIWAFNRLVNVVGNVLGTSGYHTVYENSRTSSGTPGSPDRSIYLLGYSASSEQIASNVPYDPLVVRTLFRWGNYDYATGKTHWDSSEVPAGVAVPSQTLPPSLFLSSKPGWWGAMPWPPIGPDVTGGQDPSGHVYKIPAQLCYETSRKNADGTLNFSAANCYGGANTSTPSPAAAPKPPTNLTVR